MQRLDGLAIDFFALRARVGRRVDVRIMRFSGGRGTTSPSARSPSTGVTPREASASAACGVRTSAVT